MNFQPLAQWQKHQNMKGAVAEEANTHVKPVKPCTGIIGDNPPGCGIQVDNICLHWC